MTRGDILTKAIAIAKRNGFDVSDDFFTEIPVESWIREGQDMYFSLIFCHDFAFCFFGNNVISIEDYSEDAEEVDLTALESPLGFLMSNRKNIKMRSWQYHLIQMTLQEDPLMYLYEFFKDHEQTEFN